MLQIPFWKGWNIVCLCKTTCLSVLAVYLFKVMLAPNISDLHSMLKKTSYEMMKPPQEAEGPREKSALLRARSSLHQPDQREVEERNPVGVFRPQFPSRAVPTVSPPRLLPPTAQNSVFFITCNVMGNLGNRLFEYASLLGIAHWNRMTPFYPSSSNLQNTFRVTHIHDWPHDYFTVVIENYFSSYDPKFEKLAPKNTTILNYFQSWKYFHFMRETIIKEFTFKERIQLTAEKILSKHFTRIETRTRVGIHVRRGDMLMMEHRGYHVAPASYILKAMDYMRHKHHGVIFIVVSDDPAWCKSILNTTDFVIAQEASADVHMAVLSLCDHVIMTVGTFGWWGGYLSGGEVLYYWDPTHLLHNPPLPVEIQHPEDYFLPSWIPLTG